MSFVVLAAIFGTLYLPGRMPQKYGINVPMPDGYAGQLAQPFRPRPAAPPISGKAV